LRVGVGARLFALLLCCKDELIGESVERLIILLLAGPFSEDFAFTYGLPVQYCMKCRSAWEDRFNHIVEVLRIRSFANSSLEFLVLRREARQD